MYSPDLCVDRRSHRRSMDCDHRSLGRCCRCSDATPDHHRLSHGIDNRDPRRNSSRQKRPTPWFAHIPLPANDDITDRLLRTCKTCHTTYLWVWNLDFRSFSKAKTASWEELGTIMSSTSVHLDLQSAGMHSMPTSEFNFALYTKVLLRPYSY
jgi:hypothetical protein